MPKTTTTINGFKFTDYSIADLKAEAKALAKSKAFSSGKPVKFDELIIRVTNNGAQVIIRSNENFNGEIERGTVL